MAEQEMAEVIEATTETTAEVQEATTETEKTFTQEEVNRIIAERLSRAKSTPPSDYEELKEKAQKLEEFSTQYEEVKGELEALKAKTAHAELVARVARETGVPEHLIHGNTEEELKKSATALSEYIKAVTPSYPTDMGGSAKGASIVNIESIEKIADPVKRVRERAMHMDLYK